MPGEQIAQAVEAVAVEAADWFLAAGEAQSAEACAERGIRAKPHSFRLWELRFRAGAAGSSPGLEGVWSAAGRVLKDDRGRFRDLYEQLRREGDDRELDASV